MHDGPPKHKLILDTQYTRCTYCQYHFNSAGSSFGTSNGDIAIANRFDFENFPSFCNCIEGIVQGFQQLKHLRRIWDTAPRGKAYNVGKQYGGMQEKISNGFARQKISGEW
jgi:hypothetical protein